MATGARPGGWQKKRVELELDTVAGDGRFSGYASIFGAVDLGRDVIEPGAFAECLGKRRPSSSIRSPHVRTSHSPDDEWHQRHC